MSDTLHIVCPHCNATNRVPREKLAASGHCGRCKGILFDHKPVELTRENFQQQLQYSDVPVIVDFWAPWCGPCKSFSPVFDAAAAELEPRVRLAKVDAQDQQTVAAHFGIRSIPTLIAFDHGRELARQSGATDRAGFMRWVDSVI